jgi:glutaredoxin 3
MYVKPGCPYCEAARAAFREQGVEWEERDATVSGEWRAELFEHSSGSGLVPTIVSSDGVTVGWQGGG